MSRLVAPIGVVAFFLGMLLILPQGGPPTPSPSAASAAVLSDTSTASVRSPAATDAPIPAGHRVQVPQPGIDLAIVEGDIERDTVRQKTPEGHAFDLPG